MKRETIAKRSNCRAVIAYHEIHGKNKFFSVSEAAKYTGLCTGTVRRLLGNGKHSITGWRFIYDGTRKAEPEIVLRLTKNELDRLYELLRYVIEDLALRKPYQENYTWPFYDKVAELVGNVNNSHDQYEYWRDWLDKNRDDLYEDRYADREDEDE